jgi:hypothetical protein
MCVKFRKSRDLLSILLQFTCSKTSRLCSILRVPLVATCLSLVTSSVSLLLWFVFTSYLLVFCQTSVGCTLILSLLQLSSSRSLKFCLPPPKPQTLECGWLSFLTPLWFMCSPFLPNSQFSIQLFGSTNVISNVFTLQLYMPFNVLICHHGTSLCLSAPLRTSLNCVPRLYFD